VHKLSPGFTSKSLAKNLGNVLGSFLDYDPAVNIARWNNYMLIRVWLDNRFVDEVEEDKEIGRGVL
ncbi:hypothetical protein J1N35_011369, partial [Gossypium stocksii]